MNGGVSEKVKNRHSLSVHDIKKRHKCFVQGMFLKHGWNSWNAGQTFKTRRLQSRIASLPPVVPIARPCLHLAPKHFSRRAAQPHSKAQISA
jgi:hypothetical protein